MPKGQRLLLAISILVAVIGFISLTINIRAALQSKVEAASESAEESSSSAIDASTRAPSNEGEHEESKSPPVEPSATPTPSATPSSTTSSTSAPKKSFRSKQELAELLKKSKAESKLCRANVNQARAKLSKSLMSAEEFKGALKLLEQTELSPPSSQEIFSAFEEGMPGEWDGASFLEESIAAARCDTLIHYKLLKSVVEKAAHHPERFPMEQIRSASRAFLTLGSDKPLPLSVEQMRLSFLKDLIQNHEVDAAFEQKAVELLQSGKATMDQLQVDQNACQGASDCLQSLPNEFEKSKALREAYLRLIQEIWPK